MDTTPSHGRTYRFGIGDRLRVAREVNGLSQDDLGKLIGISKGTVNNYENGHTRPKVIAVRAWALATGFDLEWLETGVEGKVGPSPSSERRPGIAVTGENYHIPHRQVIALPVSDWQTACNAAASLPMLPRAA